VWSSFARREKMRTRAASDDPAVGATNPLIKARGRDPSSVAAAWLGLFPRLSSSPAAKH
jgi:hypothetical protein